MQNANDATVQTEEHAHRSHVVSIGGCDFVSFTFSDTYRIHASSIYANQIHYRTAPTAMSGK